MGWKRGHTLGPKHHVAWRGDGAWRMAHGMRIGWALVAGLGGAGGAAHASPEGAKPPGHALHADPPTLLRADVAFVALVGAATGFSRAVRLPVRWRNHADADAQARIDPVFLARVEGNPLHPNGQAVPDEVVQLRFRALWQSRSPGA